MKSLLKMTLFQNRGLFYTLVAWEVNRRYRSTTIGLFWLVTQPLFLIGIYTFVFAFVFQPRWVGEGSTMDFIIWLFCGLVVYNFLIETITAAPLCIVNRVSYVKKFVFPLELIPATVMGVALFNLMVGLLILALMIIFHYQSFYWSMLLVPVLMLPLLLFALGAAWLIAALGVFFRDLAHIMPLVASALLFLSPIFYPLDAAPSFTQGILLFNPLTLPIEVLRASMINGALPGLLSIGVYTLFSLLSFAFGYWVFEKCRPAFADVL